MKKIILGLSFCALGLSAFEFGYMGNRSFAMGGSGVGNANSAWGLYYNPALQGVDNTFKVGYSLGLRVKERGISEIKNFNLGNISDISKVNELLKDNEVALTSENGIILQAPLSVGSLLSHSIGVGLFFTKRNVINLTGYLNTGNTSIDTINNAFIVNNNLDILEVPVSYTMQIYSGFGTFYVGAALKYIYAAHSSSKTKLTKDTDIANPFKDIFRSPNGAKTHAFGIDLGVAYALPNEWLVIGVSAKNLTSPTIKTQNLTDNATSAITDSSKLKMDAQYRLGISTRIVPRTTIAMDFDLKPNYEFGGFNTQVDSNKVAFVPRKKVQYISLGAMIDASILDVRLGMAKDIKEKSAKDGWLLSAGIGIGYFDFSFFTSTKMSKLVSKLPTEFGVKLGGSFSF